MNPNEKITQPVPDGFSDRLKDRLCAAILAEQGADALDPDPPQPRSRRWLWGAVPAAALATLAAVLLVLRPKNAPADAIRTETESAFAYFTEAIQTGYDFFAQPYSDNPQTPAI